MMQWLTFFDLSPSSSQHGNAGACGRKRGDSEYIVALHPSLYNGGARCGQKISLTNKATGKTLQAEGEKTMRGDYINMSKLTFTKLRSVF